MAYETYTARRDANPRADATVSTGIPFWDMMLSLGKVSQAALTSYAAPSDPAPQPDHATARQASSSVEVIPVGEETLNVGTRLVSGETTRVRRVVVETPVKQDVSLREERVVVERRKPTAATATASGILTESTIEMSDSFEVVEVWKSVRVTEEVVLRREATVRIETVQDTVRRDEVTVEQAKRPVPALRRDVEVASMNGAAALQPAPKPEPAAIATEMKKAAERLEADAAQQAKPHPEATAKHDQKPAARAQAEQPKSPLVLPPGYQANAAHDKPGANDKPASNDKPGSNNKG